MSRNTIVVLGDSASMTIGAEQAMYPFQIAKRPVWATSSRMINCSIPGFTSADACAFFFRNLKDFETLAGVIIYLGNCDTLASELKKGRYSRWRDRLARLARLGKPPQRQRLKNRLLHYEWNGDFDQYAEAPVAPQDYEHNIAKIAVYCRQKQVPVVLVRPQAHVLFPAGAGKGNFVFYHYLGLDDRIGGSVDIPDTRFAAAMQLYDESDYASAGEAYNEILLEEGPLSANLEFKVLAAHNYAICRAREGERAEAKFLLELIANERSARKEIAFYNLAMLAREMGDKECYRQRLVEAYEADGSMYRVRAPYKQAIDRLAERFPYIRVIAQDKFVSDRDFVDHCHPLPHAQARMADEIMASGVFAETANGQDRLAIENRLFNPEYAEGNETEFHSYFRSFSRLSSEKIRCHVERLRGVADVDDWGAAFAAAPADIRNALDYALTHPAFPTYRHALRLGPAYPCDAGRFPEFFTIRALIPFLRAVEETSELDKFFRGEAWPLLSADALMAMLPETSRQWVADAPPDLDEDQEKGWRDAILDRARADLEAHLVRGNQVHARLKSTIFWYFRETLRFGPHSRISMRYERVVLENISEALAVAAYLDFKLNSKRQKALAKLSIFLQDVVGIHEKYCAMYAPDDATGSILRDYDEKLLASLVKLKGMA